ncbi:MAG: ParA family protein [Acidimicrobiia bacterium]|nr:ParA family protein [Acidimicrobiia bacterium]
MRVVAFFNNKGGVGKTSLVYHLAWMYSGLDRNVVAADLDPQANLTAMFIDDASLEPLWEGEGRTTIYGALEPLLDSTGDVRSPHLVERAPGLHLVAGDLKLASAEDQISCQWTDCLDRRPRAFRVVSALWRALKRAATEAAADLVLVDVGPNLGALNRAALVAADHVVVPLTPDLYSIRGLRSLGPTLRGWRRQWVERRHRNPVEDLALPDGAMRPIGYVVRQHAIRPDRPVMAYQRWVDRIPAVYSKEVCGQDPQSDMAVGDDPNCLAFLRHYRSLMPMAQEARKPMFSLGPADGAIGGHTRAVRDCHRDFRKLAGTILDRVVTG